MKTVIFVFMFVLLLNISFVLWGWNDTGTRNRSQVKEVGLAVDENASKQNWTLRHVIYEGNRHLTQICKAPVEYNSLVIKDQASN